MPKYSDLEEPKKHNDEELESEMLADLDLEDEELESTDLSGLSDDELLAELKARGLGLDEEEDLEGLEALEASDDDSEATPPVMITGAP